MPYFYYILVLGTLTRAMVFNLIVCIGHGTWKGTWNGTLVLGTLTRAMNEILVFFYFQCLHWSWDMEWDMEWEIGLKLIFYLCIFFLNFIHFNKHILHGEGSWASPS